MKNLERLVAIESYENCNKILDYIKNELESKAVEVKVFGDDTKILLAGLNTKLFDICPIVLAGHIDTVSANIKLYQTKPYVLTQIDGKAFGLGSIDMKSFTAVVLDNLEKIKDTKTPIILALTTDEETELKSVELMVETFRKLKIKPKMTILGEPTNSEFALCSNACYEYSIKFYGKACHSSRLNEGVNSICACARFISFVEDNQKNYNLTSNCGVITGGEVVNKVPDYTELKFDIRSIYPTDVDKFINDIYDFIDKLQKQYVGLVIKIDRQLAIPAFNMFDNEKLNAIAKELNIKTNSFSGGCEAGYYTSYSGDAVIFGVGDLALAHKPNEYVVVDEYKKYSNTLLMVLKCIEKYYF